MLATAVPLVAAPLLVGASTLAGRRWSERAGGLVSAFPAIVGPVLVIDAAAHGTAFASRAASGTLLGLVALAAFALAYGRTAPRWRWPVSLAAGWTAAGAAALAAGTVGGGLGTGLTAACVSLLVAHRALPPGRAAPPRRPAPRADLPLRMVLTALLVAVLAVAAGGFGAVVGGMLAALPVLACVLAVFTHARRGADAAVELLRGMLAGMSGFVLFCALVAALVERIGVAPAFFAATLAAVAAQVAASGVSVRSTRRPAGTSAG